MNNRSMIVLQGHKKSGQGPPKNKDDQARVWVEEDDYYVWLVQSQISTMAKAH